MHFAFTFILTLAVYSGANGRTNDILNRKLVKQSAGSGDSSASAGTEGGNSGSGVGAVAAGGNDGSNGASNTNTGGLGSNGNGMTSSGGVNGNGAGATGSNTGVTGTNGNTGTGGSTGSNTGNGVNTGIGGNTGGVNTGSSGNSGATTAGYGNYGSSSGVTQTTRTTATTATTATTPATSRASTGGYSYGNGSPAANQGTGGAGNTGSQTGTNTGATNTGGNNGGVNTGNNNGGNNGGNSNSGNTGSNSNSGNTGSNSNSGNTGATSNSGIIGGNSNTGVGGGSGNSGAGDQSSATNTGPSGNTGNTNGNAPPANSASSTTTQFPGAIAGTTTPASNNAFNGTGLPIAANRPACSGGNSSVTCNSNGGPGLSRQPNIVIFVMDDLGHADLSYTEGNLQTPTPNIDKLAWDGIILHRHYSNPVCTPTRAAFMTGKYVFRIGMQTAAISPGEPWGVPLQFRMQPSYFKDLGYDTYGTGKWHLGEYNRASLPSGRGFDQSYMLTSGDGNWFNYTTGWITPEPLTGRELRENGKMVYANITNNYFLPELFTNHAEKWIRLQNPNNPFFMYFATTAVHTAFEDFGAVMHTMPQYQLRPPVFAYTDKYPVRKKLLGVVQVLDEQMKRITDALTYKGIINNTIIVAFADNGAPIPSTYSFVHGSNWGSNWPLRMGKGCLFEGGVRTSAFVWSPLLPKRGRITDQLVHVTDWLPTLYEAAGGDVNQLGFHAGDLSGVSQWKSFYNGLNYGPRTELVNNIDTIGNQYAMIYQDSYGGLYKIIGGNVFANRFQGWFRTPDTSDANPQTVWTPVSVNCNFPAGVEVSICRPHDADCLFDLTNDPCETNNIAASYPSMLKLLQDKLKAYNATSIPSEIKPYEAIANPKNWDGLWVPWRDTEILDAVPLTFLPFYPSDLY